MTRHSARARELGKPAAAARPNYSKTDHEIFLRTLQENDEARNIAAEWMRERGWLIDPPQPLRQAAKPEHWAEFVDAGDIWGSRNGGPRSRIEVKQLTAIFKGADSWPFQNVIVCKQSTWDRYQPKPILFVQFSQGRRCAVIIDASDSDRWQLHTVRDSRHGNVEQPCLTTAIEAVAFIPVPERFWVACPDVKAAPRCVGGCLSHARDEKPTGGQIRTVCGLCGRFLGYRPTASTAGSEGSGASG